MRVRLRVFLVAALIGGFLNSLHGGPGVNLAWDLNPEANISGYNVYRSDRPGSGYARLNAIPLTAPSYADSSAKYGRPYYYVVTAVNKSAVESAFSAEVQASVPGASSTTYFTFLADGLIPGSGRFRSALFLSNPGSSPASASLQTISRAGTPLSWPTNLGVSDQFTFVVPPKSGTTISSLGISSPARTGWARVDSDVFMQGSVFFQFFDLNGNLVLETSTGSSIPSRHFAIPARKEWDTNTAVAVANQSDADVQLTVELTSQNGVWLATTVRVDAREQTAFFIDELGTKFDSFDGTLSITASSDILVTSLRTLGGLPVAALSLQ